MTQPDSPETTKSPPSSGRGRFAAIAALVAAVAAFVGNLDKISDVAKEWFGNSEARPQTTVVVQITRETLIEAANQAQAVAAFGPNSRDDAEEQAEGLRRAAQNIQSPIRLSGGESGAQPKWLKVAFGELGEAEIPGSENNPRVVEYLESVGHSLADGGDEMPWNAAFVNWVFQQSSIKPKGSAAARAWLSWGQAISAPRLGALAVFARPGSDYTGFLCFYLAETEDQVLCLGGNFYNSVQLSARDKTSLLGYRWPSDVQLGALADALASATSPLRPGRG